MSNSKENTDSIARVLTEALPYIQRFAGKIMVIKLGGSAMKDKRLLDTFARDLVLLKLVGLNPIAVHGGGPQISQMLDKLGIESRFVQGMRVTDEATMEVVQMVLSGQINQDIVTQINLNGGKAIGLTGKDGAMIQARPFQGLSTDASVDLGQVGEIVKVDQQILISLSDNGFVPVVAPIGYDHQGTSYNINADLVAGAIAAEVKASKLILLTDTNGVLDAEGKTRSWLQGNQISGMIDSGEIHSGMLPKVHCALKAINQGVQNVHIINGAIPHALLVELLTDEGVGTLISYADQ